MKKSPRSTVARGAMSAGRFCSLMYVFAASAAVSLSSRPVEEEACVLKLKYIR